MKKTVKKSKKAEYIKRIANTAIDKSIDFNSKLIPSNFGITGNVGLNVL